MHKYRLWSRNENQDAIDDWVTELQDRGGKRGQVRNSKQRDKISVRDIDGASPDMYRGFPQPHTRVPGEHRPARTPRGGWTAAASEDASPNGKLTYPQNMEPPSQWSPSDPSLTKWALTSAGRRPPSREEEHREAGERAAGSQTGRRRQMGAGSAGEAA